MVLETFRILCRKSKEAVLPTILWRSWLVPQVKRTYDNDNGGMRKYLQVVWMEEDRLGRMMGHQ